MKKIIITNNPLVRDDVLIQENKEVRVEYTDVTYLEVLKKVRDMVHIGHKLLTHPLSGSIKPNETPYKSVFVSEEKGNVDMDSITVMTSSITTVEKFLSIKMTPDWPERIQKDFQLVDHSLVKNALSISSF